MCRDGMTPEECNAEPWCPQCTICLPGGGGAWRPAHAYGSRPLMLGDHGEFTAWTSLRLTAGTVVAIRPSGNVDLKLQFENGTQWIEPDIEVAHSAEQWDRYVHQHDVYIRRFLSPALRSAYAEFSALGHAPLRLVSNNGKVYLPNGPLQPFYQLLAENPDGAINVMGYFSAQSSFSFFANILPVDNSALEIWLTARRIWLEIRSRWIATADAQMDEYLGESY